MTVKFAGWDGFLGLADAVTAPGSFAATVTDFNRGDMIDLYNMAFNSGASSYVYTSGVGGGAGTLTVTEGSTSVTLNMASSPQSIAGQLTLGSDGHGGTSVAFTNGAAQSPFQLWSSPGVLFTTSGGTVDGQDWARSNATDGGTPIWVETYTPASSYAPGAAGNYTIAFTTQNWLGDIQTQTPVLTETLVDPFGKNALNVGNLATDLTFSSNATTGSGGLVYWTEPSANQYSVMFQPFTVTYPVAPTSSPLTALQGSPVTLSSGIANPTDWSVSSHTSTSLVLAEVTANIGIGNQPTGTENLYFEAYSNTGAATTPGPTLVATLNSGTPFYIGYSNNSYQYRYLSLTGTDGTTSAPGLYGGSYDITTGIAGAASELLALPGYTEFDGVSSFALSNGDSLRFVEGVENGHNVIQTFLNASGTARRPSRSIPRRTTSIWLRFTTPTTARSITRRSPMSTMARFISNCWTRRASRSAETTSSRA